MKKYIQSFIFYDMLFIAIIFLLSLFHISFYLKADFINTTYPDWIVHAFRIKLLKDYGLLSWTHIWSNGISLWKSYQFLPHYFTLGIITWFNLSITRGMVLVTIILFFLLRYFIYFILRILQFQPFTAFVCTLLSYDIGQYWGGVNDFSLLFGFTFFPVFIFLWVQYFHGHIRYLFPYLAGIAFYIHPVLGYSTFALWLLGIIFSEHKVISFSNLVQFLIFLSAASLWWYPLVIRHSYVYSNAVFANKYFLGLVISSYKYYGLSLFLLIIFCISLLRILMPIKKQYRWTRVLFVYAGIYFLSIIIGISLDLPQTIDALQFTRGVTLMGIAIIFTFAPVIEDSNKISSIILQGGKIFIICLIVIEGLWFSSTYSPTPSKLFSDPVSSYLTANPRKTLADNRIWSSDIGLSSYESPDYAKFPYSYMGHLESNQISPRISPLIIYFPYRDDVPIANLNRINTYFKISGVKYIFFEDNSPFTKTLLKNNNAIYKDLGIFNSPTSIYHGFQVPWEIKNAILINETYKQNMDTFPFNLELSIANDQVALDTYVQKYTDILYKTDNFSLPISYPSQDSIQIQVPENRKSNLLYINESYDASWKAYLHNKEVPIQPTGPNFMLLHLDSNPNAGVVTMKHFWPLSFYVSLFLIILIPMELVLMNILNRIVFPVKLVRQI